MKLYYSIFVLIVFSLNFDSIGFIEGHSFQAMALVSLVLFKVMQQSGPVWKTRVCRVWISKNWLNISLQMSGGDSNRPILYCRSRHNNTGAETCVRSENDWYIFKTVCVHTYIYFICTIYMRTRYRRVLNSTDFVKQFFFTWRNRKRKTFFLYYTSFFCIGIPAHLQWMERTHWFPIHEVWKYNVDKKPYRFYFDHPVRVVAIGSIIKYLSVKSLNYNVHLV